METVKNIGGFLLGYFISILFIIGYFVCAGLVGMGFILFLSGIGIAKNAIVPGLSAGIWYIDIVIGFCVMSIFLYFIFKFLDFNCDY